MKCFSRTFLDMDPSFNNKENYPVNQNYLYPLFDLYELIDKNETKSMNDINYERNQNI